MNVSSPAGADIPASLQHFDSLPDSAEVRIPVVAALYGCSVPTVWRRVRQGLIPEPIRRRGITSFGVGDLRRNKAA